MYKIDEKIKLIEKRLKSLIPKSNGYHKKLFEAANYSLLSNAKRLRPLLVLLVIESFKKNMHLGLDPACAIELIHTYSLVHDDLPAMDNDDFRRGKPSLHKAYPEWLAILTGDYLLTYSFEILSNAKSITDSQRVDLIKTLSKYSGSEGLIGGQVADLSFEGKKIDLKKLSFMHQNKTSSLFIAAVEFGCIIGKAKKEISKKYINFAKNFGFAFQIFNDIKGSFKKSSDLKKKKSTSVSLFGLSKAEKMGLYFQKKSLAILKKLPFDTTNLELVTKSISNIN